MAKHVYVLMMLAIASIMPAQAQSDDFGIWTETAVEKKINKKLTLDAEAELRTRDDGFGELDRVLERRGGDENITRILEGLR